MLNREPKDKVIATPQCCGAGAIKIYGAIVLVLKNISPLPHYAKIKKVATDSCHLVISF
jgi:hypothetical protein